MSHGSFKLHDSEQLFFWFNVVLLQLLHIFICYPTRATRIKQSVLAPITVAAAAYVMANSPKYGGQRAGHANGLRVAYILYVMVYQLFLEPNFQDFWRRLKDEKCGGSEKDKDPSNFSFSKKFGWAVDLTNNWRGVGWTQEPTSVLCRQNYSRRPFIRSSLFNILFYFLMTNLGSTLLFGNPSFDARVHQDSDGPEAYLRRLSLLQRIPDIISWGLWFHGLICLFYSILAVISVGLRFSEPADWPNMTGSFREGYTIRRFWGRTWHQYLRLILSGFGKYVSRKMCKFKSGTNLCYYTEVYIAFFLSGFLHASGDLAARGHLPSFPFQFFMLQAFGISFEHFVMWLTTPIHSKLDVRVHKAIGYAWVVIWACWTFPMWFDPISATGQHEREKGIVFGRLVDFLKSRR